MLIVSFIPEDSENKNLLNSSLEHFFVCFHLVCLYFYQSDVAAPPLCPYMWEICKRQDQTDFHHTRDCKCHVFTRSDGQCTKAEVVSDRLKTDLVTWNSLSYLKNCYCGHVLKPKVENNTADYSLLTETPQGEKELSQGSSLGCCCRE